MLDELIQAWVTELLIMSSVLVTFIHTKQGVLKQKHMLEQGYVLIL